jgi:hypothetical protein
MKKRLEAELLSIAHRILKLKNKSEVDQLYHETQKLYEALTVLKFYGDNYEQVKSEIAVEDLEEKLSASLEEKIIETPVAVAEPILVEEPKEELVAETKEEETIETEAVAEVEVETEEKVEEEPILVGEITLEEEEIEEEENVPAVVASEEVEEEVVAESKDEMDFGAIFELAAENPNEIEDEKEDENLKQVQIEEVKAETKQISFEDLLGENYTEPVFVKPNDVTKPASKKEKIEEKSEVIVDREEGKSLSLNDKLSKTINIGLNDRIGFVKYLFGDSTEDYNRVLSQLNTFSSFEEAKDFIEEIIKPDYNNWEGVDDYAENFIALVEKKFN